MTLRARLSFLLVLLLVWSAVFYLFVIDAARNPLIDYYTYLRAAADLAAGHSIYGKLYPIPVQGGVQGFHYQHPPFLPALLTFVLPYSLRSASIGWCVLQFLAVIGVSVLATSVLRLRFKTTPLLQLFAYVSFLAVCFEPIYTAIRLGQTDVFVLLLVLAALVSLLRQSPLCGVFLGAASLLKIAPLILVLLLVRYRQWKAIVAFGLMLVVPWLILFSTSIPTDAYFGFFSAALRSDVNRGLTTDFAFVRSVLELLSLEPGGVAAFLGRIMLSGVFAFAALAQGEEGYGKARSFALMLCAMLAFMPTVHFQHLMWLLPAWFVLLLYLPEKTAASQAFERRLTHAVLVYFAMTQANLLVYQAMQHDLLRLANVLPAVTALILGLLLLRADRASPV